MIFISLVTRILEETKNVKISGNFVIILHILRLIICSNFKILAKDMLSIIFIRNIKA